MLIALPVFKGKPLYFNSLREPSNQTKFYGMRYALDKDAPDCTFSVSCIV